MEAFRKEGELVGVYHSRKAKSKVSYYISNLLRKKRRNSWALAFPSWTAGAGKRPETGDRRLTL